MADTILYLCDGEVEDCKKTICYKNPFKLESAVCRHTNDPNHALYKNASVRHYEIDDNNTLWEKEPEDDDE